MRRMRGVLSTMALLVAIPAWSIADDAKKQPPADPSAAEQPWAEFAKLGEEHRQLARLVGEWKVEAKSYYANPDQPETSEGTATFRLLMGGRYLQQNFRGQFGGRSYRGMGVSGYDNAKKKFIGMWIDNMGTGMLTTEGAYNEETHELVETGVASSPSGEEKMKMVSRYVDDDQFTFTMYTVQPNGKEVKSMEMIYTRQGDQKKKPE